jgi:uncharacterized protein YuzE
MAKNQQNNLIVNYDEQSDALSFVIRGGKEEYFEEIVPGVAVEFDQRGRVLGFEILNASRRLKKTIKPISRKIRLPEIAAAWNNG